MKRGLVVALVLVAVSGIVAAVIFLVLRDDDEPDKAPSDARTTVAAAPRIDWAKEEPKAREAIAKLETAPRSVLAPEALKEFGDRLGVAIPPGSTFAPVDGSWAPDNAGGATMIVDAKLPGRPNTPYVVVMARQGDQWKVLATVPVTR